MAEIKPNICDCHPMVTGTNPNCIVHGLSSQAEAKRTAPAPTSYQRAAELAQEVQDACNLSGVANSFAKVVLPAIWKEADRLHKGTDWVNQHPIVTLFLDKMAPLNKSQCLCAINIDHFGKANAEVEAIHRGITLPEGWDRWPETKANTCICGDRWSVLGGHITGCPLNR